MTLFPFAAAGFVAVAAFHVAALGGGDEKVARATKPLLMPLLFLAYLSGAPRAEPFAALALLAGFLGDVLLMDARLFTAGLFAFLAGHLCYAAGFLTGLPHLPAGAAAPAAAVYIAFGAFALHEMWKFQSPRSPQGLQGSRSSRVPRGPHSRHGFPTAGRAVFVCYLAALLLMSCSALLRALSGEPFRFIAWAGSLCFIASDALLGLQMSGRASRAPQASQAVMMALYIIGQTLLAVGCAF